MDQTFHPHGPFAQPNAEPPQQAQSPPNQPEANGVAAQPAKAGEGTPIRVTVRMFVFNALANLLHAANMLGKFFLEVLQALTNGLIRLCSFVLETLIQIRDAVVKGLNKMADDPKWYIKLILLIGFCVYASMDTDGVLWAARTVARSHICSLSRSGWCTTREIPGVAVSAAEPGQPNGQ